MIELTKELGTAALYGGLFLGGGGGGSLSGGLETLDTALSQGTIHLYDLDEFNPEELVITASAVGSPASKEGYMSTEQVLKAFDLVQREFEDPIKGVITNENGGHSIANGWILSAATGIPLIDAPCNGRAHPTGVMGSMGLDLLDDYISTQSAAGGKGKKAIELSVTGEMNSCAGMVRQAAVAAGGLVTVYRNPVKAAYLASHAAPGAIVQAIQIGKIFLDAKDKGEVYEGLSEFLGMEVLASGTVKEFSLTTEGGFDHGYLILSENGKSYKTTFWNEFMSVDEDEKRIATFPDLIACLNAETGGVITSAEMAEGLDIDIIRVPMENLILGAGMKNRQQFELVEKILGIPMVSHLPEGVLA